MPVDVNLYVISGNLQEFFISVNLLFVRKKIKLWDNSVCNFIHHSFNIAQDMIKNVCFLLESKSVHVVDAVNDIGLKLNVVSPSMHSP